MPAGYLEVAPPGLSFTSGFLRGTGDVGDVWRLRMLALVITREVLRLGRSTSLRNKGNSGGGSFHSLLVRGIRGRFRVRSFSLTPYLGASAPTGMPPLLGVSDVY